MRARRRRVLALALGIFLAIAFVGGSLTALAVTHPVDGPAYAIRSALEERFGSREIRYNVHQFLGMMFSICPCTEGLSREQYRRAGFHRPTSAVDLMIS